MAKSNGDEEDREEGNGLKRTKHRSPNYPMVGLRKAVERTKQLHDKYKRAWVPIHLAQELWGYRQHSGAGNQCVAALKSYGFVDVEGEGKGRRVRITDPAFRIVLNGADRNDLLQKAVLGPSIYRELWDKYRVEEFPDDALIKHYLQFDREDGTFNPDVVDSFISNMRDSFRYSGLLSGDIVGDESGTDAGDRAPEGDRPKPKVGDLVQWTSGGVDQFREPRRIVGFSDDGEWAFVEGSLTGALVSELTVMERNNAELPPQKVAPKVGPPNPHYRPDEKVDQRDELPPAKVGIAKAETTLDEGPVAVRWPDEMSAASVHEFEYFLKGLIERARRKAGIKPEAKTRPDDKPAGEK